MAKRERPDSSTIDSAISQYDYTFNGSVYDELSIWNTGAHDDDDDDDDDDERGNTVGHCSSSSSSSSAVANEEQEQQRIARRRNNDTSIATQVQNSVVAHQMAGIVSADGSGGSAGVQFTSPPPSDAPELPVTGKSRPPESKEEVHDLMGALQRDIGILPEVSNVVATVELCVRIDLKRVALEARNSEYNPRRFPAVVIRIREPTKATALLFASGKMTVVGTRDAEAAKFAARKFARIIQKLGYKVRFVNFKIQNIVSSINVGFELRLSALSETHSMFATFDPELFPGLVYRMIRPRAVLLIFRTGKLVITAAKSYADMCRAFRLIYPVLVQFRRPQRPIAPPALTYYDDDGRALTPMAIEAPPVSSRPSSSSSSSSSASSNVDKRPLECIAVRAARLALEKEEERQQKRQKISDDAQ